MPRDTNSKSAGQSTMNEWVDTAREHPVATAAAAAGAAGAVAAGVFLWSRRREVASQVNRISRTASEMGRKASERASRWACEMQSGSSSRELMKTEGANESNAIEASRSTQSRRSRSSGKSNRATGGQSSSAGQNIHPGRTGAQAVTH